MLETRTERNVYLSFVFLKNKLRNFESPSGRLSYFVSPAKALDQSHVKGSEVEFSFSFVIWLPIARFEENLTTSVYHRVKIEAIFSNVSGIFSSSLIVA